MSTPPHPDRPRRRIHRVLPAVLLTGCLVLVTGGAEAAAHDRRHGPPRGTLEMTGDVGDFVPGEIDDPVHDPAIVKDHRTYYVASTDQRLDFEVALIDPRAAVKRVRIAYEVPGENGRAEEVEFTLESEDLPDGD
jgi:hypothetical protein